MLAISPLSRRDGALILAIGTLTFSVILFQLLKCIVEFLHVIVWIPWKVKRYMRQQGYSGPPFSCWKSNMKEMQELAQKAVLEPLHTITHDIEPRVSAPIVAWKKLYGKKIIYHPGGRVCMSTSDPEAVKEILSTKSSSDEYGRGPVPPLVLEILGRNGIIMVSGHEKWARQRRVVRPAYYAGKSKEMVVQMASWIEPWIQNLENLVVENGGPVDFDITAAVGGLTKDILVTSVFGTEFEKGRDAFNNLDKLTHLVVQREMTRSTNPEIQRSRPTRTLQKEIRHVKSQVSKCLREIIQHRRHCVQLGSSESYGEDLLGLLLADSDSGRNLSGDEYILDQCRAFYFAGSETVTSSILWAIMLLAHYSDWQERIRAEGHELFHPDASLGADKLMKLKQLEMFVNETLRLYPPAPILIREVAKDNATLLGEPLPKFLNIHVNIVALHRNKEYWGDDALEFNPGRFTEGVASACKNTIYAFSPFGVGPRTCVAQAFALTEVKLVVTMFLQRFSFRLSPSYRHEPMSHFALQPKFGVPIILERLNSAS